MKLKKKLLHITCPVILVFAQLAAAGQPGITDTVFNRRFIPSIKPAMTYEQIVSLVGVPGIKVEEKNIGSATVQYRWKGSRASVLTVRIGKGGMIDATVLAPNGHTYAVQNSGEVVDITK